MGQNFLKHRLIVLRGATLALLLVTLVVLIFQKKLKQDYPTDNFISLTIMSPMENAAQCILADECTIDNIHVPGSQASGLAFKTYDNVTYILTADHFCEDFLPDSTDIFGFSDMLYVQDYLGNTWKDATVVASDPDNDLCLVSSRDMKSVQKIRLSKKMPAMGEDVFAISEPLGIGPNGTALHFTGKFSGCDNNGTCYYSIPATFGSSGSIILDSRGEMIGMIQKAVMMLQVMSIGVGIDHIDRFLHKAEIKLEVDLR